MELTINKNVQLGEVFSMIARKKMQVKLLVGMRDAINGYGWHVRYYVEVIQCIEYCSKCRLNHNVNYKDDYLSHHQHSHHQEYKTIFSKEFMSEDDMCMELTKLTN